MKELFSNWEKGLGQINFFSTRSKARYILILLVSTMFFSSATAQDLDPNLPPGDNFDLSYWKLTRPNQQERDADQLAAGYTVADEFYTDSITGAMVFWCPNDGATGGSTYPRNELREMIRRFDTSIPTQGINKNNWVFSSSTMANQEAAGGVDGVMTATCAVDHVSLIKYTHLMMNLAEFTIVNCLVTQRDLFTLPTNLLQVLSSGMT